MFSVVASPLLKVEGSRIKSARVSPPAPPSPLTSGASSTTSGGPASVICRIVVATKVLLYQGKQYAPRTQKPRVLTYNAQQHRLRLYASGVRSVQSRRVILHRFQTENGAAVFALGTRIDRITTRDAEDIPATEILNYVTSEELAHFENADYEEEAEKERIRILTMKPRGRPRKNVDGTAPTPRPKQPSAPMPGSYAAMRDPNQPKKRGRPVGWRKGGVPPIAAAPSAPSFNGPQPTGEGASTGDTTEEASPEPGPAPQDSPIDIQKRTGVYSMVAASRLVPIPGEIAPRQPSAAPSSDAIEIVDSEAVTPSDQSDAGSPVAAADSERPSTSSDSVILIDSSSNEDTPRKSHDLNHPARHDEAEDERTNLLRVFASKGTSDKANKGANLQERSPTRIFHTSSRPIASPKNPSGLLPYQSISQPTQVILPRKAPPTNNMNTAKHPSIQTPVRPPKRKSLTPHFPGSGTKIPRWTVNSSPGSPVSRTTVGSHTTLISPRVTKGLPAGERHLPLSQSQPLSLSHPLGQRKLPGDSGPMQAVISQSEDRAGNETSASCRSTDGGTSEDDDSDSADDSDDDDDDDDNNDSIDDADGTVDDDNEVEVDSFHGVVETTNIDPRLVRSLGGAGHPRQDSVQRGWEDSEEESDEVIEVPKRSMPSNAWRR